MRENCKSILLSIACIVLISACSKMQPAKTGIDSLSSSGTGGTTGATTGGTTGATTGGTSGGTTGATPGLLDKTDLVYKGSFRVPQTVAGNDPQGFSYSSAFMTGNVYYDPARNNAPSIYVSGYLSAGYVSINQSLAQISIPTLANYKQVGLNGLSTATLLQNFADPTAGHNPLNDKGFCSYLHYLGNLLGFCSVAYDASGSLASTAFTNSLNLSVNNGKGPYPLGNVSQDMFGGYATEVPPEWQTAIGAKVLAGNGPWSIISVNSAGPGLHTVDVDAMLAAPAAGTRISSTPLVYYPTGFRHLGEWNSNLANQSINGVAVPTITVTDPKGRTGLPFGSGGPNWTIPYNDSASRVRGVLFASGTRSVLFFGKKGLGPYCYGEGTANPALDHQIVPGTNGVIYCYDPDDVNGKGDHSYPYTGFVWAYDVNDLVAAKQGLKAPWLVLPYKGWTMDITNIGGVSWDSTTRTLYVSEECIDPGGGYFCGPVIHAYSVPVK